MSIIDKAGTITLYYREEVVDSFSYESNYNRKNKIETWKTLYGPKWNDCYYHISLNNTSEEIKPDGTNLRKDGRRRNQKTGSSGVKIVIPKFNPTSNNYDFIHQV